MTNTTKSPVPTTIKGVTCGLCSHGFGKDRVEIKHASVAAVRECFTASKSAPVVEIPVAEALAVITATLPVEAPKPKVEAPKKFAQYSASCPKKGCKTKRVAGEWFVLKCYNHGKVVRTRAKQLTGQFSSSAKHKCDPRCTGAVGSICVCQCGGANHGKDHMNIAVQ